MSKPTILIAEDDQALSDAYKIVLSREGYNIITVPNGAEALKVLNDNKIDLIMLDYKMPIMNGLEFLQTFSKKDKSPLPKTIIFSNHECPEDIESAYKNGASRYIIKSWTSPKKLIKLVSSTLNA